MQPGKGPTINGPYSHWGVRACDFDTLRAQSADLVNHAVVEYSKGGCLNAGESREQATTCMAAFMSESCQCDLLAYLCRALVCSVGTLGTLSAAC